MSSSPQSEITVALLWGDRWFVSGRTGPLPFAEIDRAAETLLGDFEERGRPDRLRLLFQSPDFTGVPVACPQGNRATLQSALQGEWPVLADPTKAWSYEPITGGGTLLHFEREPILYGLVEQLQAHGVAVESVWPLASILILIPAESPEIVALTVIAVAESLTLVARQTPEGGRETVAAAGEGAAILFDSTMRIVGDRGDGSLCLVSFDEAGARRCEQFAPGSGSRQDHLQWDDVIRTARSVRLSHPAQLLPPARRADARRFVTVVTLLAFAAACLFGVLMVRETAAQRTAADQQAAAVQRLRAEVTALRQNQAEAEQLRAQLAAVRPGRVACAALMRTLVRELPSQIVLTALHADHDGFRFTGGVSGSGLTDKAWGRWLEQLKAPGTAWELVPPVPAPPAADFSLKGAWR